MGLLITGIIFVVLVVLPMTIKITREYERGVIFRLGRLLGVKGPGIFLIIPFIDKMTLIGLRVITLDIPSQDVISKDNIPIKVDAVLYFKVSDPIKAVIEIENFIHATSQISQTSLRGVVGSITLDELLSQREKINKELHHVIDEATDPWGIKVSGVEIKHVEIPELMQRAIARQAEAERMRRAKIILAEGEYQASAKLKQAGEVLGADPITLRYLETLSDVAKEQNTTILFPIEMLKFLGKVSQKKRNL